jgi:hypothetical protein
VHIYTGGSCVRRCWRVEASARSWCRSGTPRCGWASAATRAASTLCSARAPPAVRCSPLCRCVSPSSPPARLHLCSTLCEPRVGRDKGAPSVWTGHPYVFVGDDGGCLGVVTGAYRALHDVTRLGALRAAGRPYVGRPRRQGNAQAAATAAARAAASRRRRRRRRRRRGRGGRAARSDGAKEPHAQPSPVQSHGRGSPHSAWAGASQHTSDL